MTNWDIAQKLALLAEPVIQGKRVFISHRRLLTVLGCPGLRVNRLRYICDTFLDREKVAYHVTRTTTERMWIFLPSDSVQYIGTTPKVETMLTPQRPQGGSSPESLLQNKQPIGSKVSSYIVHTPNQKSQAQNEKKMKKDENRDLKVNQGLKEAYALPGSPPPPTLDEVLSFASQWIGNGKEPAPIEEGFAEWWHGTVDNSRNNGWDSMKCWKIGFVLAWRARCRKAVKFKPPVKSRAMLWREASLKVDQLTQDLSNHEANPRNGPCSKEQWADYLAIHSQLVEARRQLDQLSDK